MRESREDGGTARREGVYLVVAAEEDSAVKNVLKRMRVEYVARKAGIVTEGGIVRSQ